MRIIQTARGCFTAVILVLTLFCFHLQASEGNKEESLNPDKILAELEKQMNLSREKWEQLKPLLEEKSKALSESLKQSIDESVIELNTMAEKFDQMSKDAEKKVKDILTSDEAQKFREELSRIDRQAIEQAKEKMIADLNDVLELTEDQIEELKPVFEESFNKLSQMIQGLAAEGSANWQDFKEDLEAVTKDLFNKVQETLDDDQMKKLKEYKEKEKEEIQHALFKA
jgi:hypothetical protein